MTRIARGIVVLLVATVIGGLIDWAPEGRFISAAEGRPKKKAEKGPGKGKNDLQKAYDALTDLAAWTDAGRTRPPRELASLVEQARDIYRDAVRASREEEPRQADELAAAAHDAARGLVHAFRADAPSIRGIPVPPLRDPYELDDLLRRTRDRLEDTEALESRGTGRAFSDAARRLYDRARQASRDDPVRALNFARAAEAWTHVGEHLAQADFRREAPPPPERRRERPLPPDERRDPPPPPR